MGFSKFDIMPEADIVIGHINGRLNKGLNTTVYIIGLSGTGKSSTSIRIAELLLDSRPEDDKPNILIVDSLLEFVKAVRASKSGDVVVIEEVSVLFPSRRAMAKENVSIAKILDTCRKKELCLIANAPLWNSIDSHMRALGHLLIETLKINKTEKVVISKFHRLQTNPMSGVTYRHTMQRAGIDVARMFTRMPDKKRWDAYEKQKDKFMDDLYNDLQNEEEIKKIKKEKEYNRNRWDVAPLIDKHKKLIEAIDEKHLGWDEVTNILGYANKETAKGAYKNAKDRLKRIELIKAQQQENEKKIEVPNPEICF